MDCERWSIQIVYDVFTAAPRNDKMKLRSLLNFTVEISMASYLHPYYVSQVLKYYAFSCGS